MLRRGADIGLRIPILLLRETLDVGCCSVAERIGTWKSASHREPNSNEARLSRARRNCSRYVRESGAS